jgi:F-type H+-transporting ATPase subunit gamma
MLKLIDIRNRIQAVESIEGIARTLSTVSSAKLSRTRIRAAGLRMYVERLRAMLGREFMFAASHGLDPRRYSPFLQPKKTVERVLIVHLAGDRGMCGNYNVSVNRALISDLEKFREAGIEVAVYLKGRNAKRWLSKRLDVPFIGCDEWSRNGVTDQDVSSLFARCSKAFLEDEADEVWCRYTRYVNTLQRGPALVRLLPLAFEARLAPGAHDMLGELEFEAQAESHARRWHEPSFEDVFSALVEELVRTQFEDVQLESFASEQAARMVSMEEASERASRMLQELRVKYNRMRREAITSDLLGVLFASRMRGEGVRGGNPTRGEGARR